MANELDKIKNIIAKHRKQLAGKFEVKEIRFFDDSKNTRNVVSDIAIGIFGSYARGEQKKSVMSTSS